MGTRPKIAEEWAGNVAKTAGTAANTLKQGANYLGSVAATIATGRPVGPMATIANSPASAARGKALNNAARGAVDLVTGQAAVNLANKLKKNRGY